MGIPLGTLIPGGVFFFHFPFFYTLYFYFFRASSCICWSPAFGSLRNVSRRPVEDVGQPGQWMTETPLLGTGNALYSYCFLFYKGMKNVSRFGGVYVLDDSRDIFI